MQELSIQAGVESARGAGMAASLFGQAGVFQNITNMMLFLIGAISVFMIIIGGFRYVLSGGDSSAVTTAKNTILYAVIGVIVAILAYSIIHFIIGAFASDISF